MSDDNKKKSAQPDKLIAAPNEKRIDESIANRRDHSLDRPQTKFEAPNPWPEPKDDKKKENKG